VEFEWDPAKSEATYRQRGFDFAYAARVFAGSDRLEAEDTRAEYGETRVRAIGQVGPDVLVVVYTVRQGAVRIISARLANRKERSLWRQRSRA
jgi:uncharacterized DUF497 family protein